MTKKKEEKIIDALDNILDGDINMAGQNITILLLIQDGATDEELLKKYYFSQEAIDKAKSFIN